MSQAIYKAVQTCVSELRSGVPAQQSSSTAAAAEPATKAAAAAAPGSNGVSSGTSAPAATAKPAAAKSKSRCTVKLTERFYARAEDIFECFVVQGRVQAFTRSPAVVDPQPGGSFSWFNGHVQVRCLGLHTTPAVASARESVECLCLSVLQLRASTFELCCLWAQGSKQCMHLCVNTTVHGYFLMAIQCNRQSICCCVSVCAQGKFEELQPGKQLVFSWRFNNWEDNCYSKVGVLRAKWSGRQPVNCVRSCSMLLPVTRL